MSPELMTVRDAKDILPAYRDTPIADLFGYHALGRPIRSHARADLLIVTCMDCRVEIRIPRVFAYVIRTAGASVRGLEFNVEYAVAVAGVKAIALIGHDDCAMTAVRGRRDDFVRGLARRTGCSTQDATGRFDEAVERFAIDDAAAFTRSEASRLATRFPQVVVAPLFYDVRSGSLAQILAV